METLDGNHVTQKQLYDELMKVRQDQFVSKIVQAILAVLVGGQWLPIVAAAYLGS